MQPSRQTPSPEPRETAEFEDVLEAALARQARSHGGGFSAPGGSMPASQQQRAASVPGAPQRGLSSDLRAGAHPTSSPPNALSPQLSQDLEGMEQTGPESFGGGTHELYRALRGSQGDDPLTDELLWDGDFLTSQREFLQKKQEEQLLERLERRMGSIKAAPKELASSADATAPELAAAAAATSPVSPAGPSLAAVAAAAVGGNKLMSLLGRMRKPAVAPAAAAPSTAAASPAAAAAAAVQPVVIPTAVSSPAASRAESPVKASQPESPIKGTSGSAAAAAAVAGAVQVLATPGSLETSADTRASTTGSATTTPRFLAQLMSSFRVGSPRTAGKLGNLVADDDSKDQAKKTSAAGAADEAADVVAEVNLLTSRKEAAKAAEAEAKEKQDAIARMDTPTRLQLEAQELKYSWPRQTAIKICTDSNFELIVLILIFGNCISLAAYNPLDHDGPRNQMLQQIDLILNIAFTVEMFLRIISMGGLLAYLHHPWNAFDCVMVLAGYTTFIPMEGTGSSGLEGLKALRALRAMRPLRTITRFPALRSIVVCFLEAVPLLVSVAAMLFFFLFLFAVAGTELFGEAFHWGCRNPTTGDAEVDYVPMPDEFGCGSRDCPTDFSECHKFSKSQSREMAGFDNVGYSMLSVFQSMTLSNWSFTMYRTMDYLNPAVVIYWLVMIIFGSFFVLNLFLAVLKSKFAKAKNLLDEKRRHRRALKSDKNHKNQNILMKATGWMKGRVAAFMANRADRDSLSSHISDVLQKRAASEQGSETQRSDTTGLTGFTEVVGPGVKTAAETAPTAAWGSAPTGATVGMVPRSLSNASSVGGKPTAVGIGAGSRNDAGAVERQLTRSTSMGSGMSGMSGYTGVTGVTGMSGMSNASTCLLAVEEFDESVQDLPPFKRYTLMLQYRIRVMVTSSWFNNLFLIGIFANTVCLAMTHEGMSHEFEEGLHQANFVFTYLFTAEMLLKMIGLGPFKYLSDTWNLFDTAVVAFSLVELVTELMARSSASGLTALRSVRSLRVLRSFRVLRVMKMFKYLESLKMIASVLISSMGSFASIVILLVLFWLVFSIVSLHVFGGLTIDEPWPNADDLVNSLILNFNTLNLENFQTAMYSFIRATSYASSAFWLAWIIVGKYILLTLFLAVTLDAFERKYEVDMKKGVRSQSVASSVFSRIKNFGRKVKGSAAGSAATSAASGDASAKANSFSISGNKSGNEVQHDSIAAFRTTTEDAATAIVSVSGGKRRITFNEGPVYSSHSGSGECRHTKTPTDQRRVSIGEVLHPGQPVPEQRRTTDSRNHSLAGSNHGGRGNKGPVAEGTADGIVEGWGSGLRKRRHMLGLQVQYGVVQLGQISGFAGGIEQHGSRRSSRDSNGSRPASREAPSTASSREHSSSMQLLCGAGVSSGNVSGRGALRRTSSSGGSTTSSTASFRLKRDTAAAFAAAAAADAVLPHHVFPDLVDSSSDEESWYGAQQSDGNGAAADTPLWPAMEVARLPQQQQRSRPSSAVSSLFGFSRSAKRSAIADSINSRNKRKAGSSISTDDSEEAPYTWHEFLSTVAAIDYPSVVQQMQQQRQLDYMQQQGTGSLRGQGNAPLGPIAEGIETDNSSVSKGAPSYSLGLDDVNATSLSHGIAAAAAAALSDTHFTTGQKSLSAAAGLSSAATQHTPPGHRGISRKNQLSLDVLDSELESLGLESTAAQPTTPQLLVHGNSSSGSPGVDNVNRWPGLDHQDSRTTSPPSKVRALPGILITPREVEQSKDSASEPLVTSRAASHNHKERRVTLLTESMKRREDGPGSEPHSPKYKYNPNSQPSQPSVLKGGSLPAPDLDDVLDMTARPNSAAASTAGGTALSSMTAAASAAARSHDLLLTSAAGQVGDATDLLLLSELGSSSVEPSITAKAIKKRKQACVVGFSLGVADGSTAGLPADLPGGIADPLSGSGRNPRAMRATSDGVGNAAETVVVESSAPSESRSLAGSEKAGPRRFSTGSEAALSEGSFNTGVHSQGSHSGTWSVGASSHRSSASRTYPELGGTSLWLFSEDNLFRLRLFDIVTAKWFDYVMFFFIILNCAAMAYEHPHMDREQLDGAILFWSDMVFTIVFSIEALMKVIAFGFKPYLTFFQNQVDFLIVVTSIIMLFLDTMDLEIIKALRVLRAIKPLRALTRSAGMQMIFKSLTLSLAAMGNVSIVVLLFFLIFAILGVQLFHGKFHSCNDDSVPDREACTGTFMLDGMEVPRVWSNAPYNFDNLGMALVSLFVTSTLNGYLEIMKNAMAAPEEPGLQPQHMNNWSAFFYFAAFVLVVAYTLLNLYIGVVFYQFSRIRLQSQTGSAFLTDVQTEWVELSRLVFRLKPPEKSPVPANRFRKKMYYIVQSKQFEFALMAVIVANSALMATTYYGEPEEMRHVVEALNYAFTCLYVVEFLVKLIGLGWEGYWKVSWNKFDLILLVTSIVDMVVALVMGSQASFLKVQKIMRLLRLARVVKLMRSMKGLRSLFGTLIVSLPAFWNVGALLGLLFFMYAYVGMLLLSGIKHNGGLNEHTNFGRFWSAALTLFKVATNDNWTDVMVACMIQPPDCDPALGECGTWVVYPYFLSFVLLVSIIMLNLFTAVILESFEAQQEQDRWKLRPDHLDEFVELWSEYDDGSGTIDPKDLEAMLLRLSPPLGLGPSASSTDVLRFVFDLDIPLLQGRVPFQRTAYELVRRCSGAEIPEGILKDQIDRLVQRAFRNLKADEVLNFSVAVTVMRVQRKWRARMRAAKLKRKREFRAERGVAPAYSDVVANRDVVLKGLLLRRQGGDLRWRPNATYRQQWAAADQALTAEQAAAAAAAQDYRSSSSSYRRSGSSDVSDGAEGQHWTSLSKMKASADGWMHKVSDGLHKLNMARFFGSGAYSIGSSMWGFGRASSKAIPSGAPSIFVSEAGSKASELGVASRATSDVASGALSDAASLAPSVQGSRAHSDANDS